MLPKEKLTEFKEKINDLETRCIPATSYSRIKDAPKFDKKADYLEILELYKILIDNGYPVHSSVSKLIEDMLLIDEAISTETKYFNENPECANKEHAELLVRLANVIYGCGECLDEVIDYEEKNSVNKDTCLKVDRVVEQDYRTKRSLELLAKANQIFETAETYCLIGELFFDNCDYTNAEKYFQKAVIKNKGFAKAYVDQARILEKRHSSDTAIKFLLDALNAGVESNEIRIVLIGLCTEKLEKENNNDKKAYYIGITREQYGILKDRNILYGSDALFDD